MLQPSIAQVLQPMSSTTQVQTANNQQLFNTNKQQSLGATWNNSGNLNIDLDNLLGNKQAKHSNAPSMNQLASNPTSPINQPKLLGQAPYGFNQSFGLSTNSPGFNQANNFAAFK